MTRKICKSKAALAMAVGAALSISTSARAGAPAADNSTNPAYAAEAGGAWKGLNSTPQPPGTDNGGSGFGVWNFGGGFHDGASSPLGDTNHFIDGVDFTHSTYNDLGSTAFGLTNMNDLYATTNAKRPFISPMQTGDVFSAKFDSPAYYDIAQQDPNTWYPFAIIEMQNAAGVKTWGMEAGDNGFGAFYGAPYNWRYTDATSTNVSMDTDPVTTGVQPIAPTDTSDGSAFSFQLTSPTTGVLIFDKVAGGYNVTIPINLMAGAPANISFTAYSLGGDTDGQREFYFDNLAITNPNPNNEWKKTGTNAGNWGDAAHWTNGIVPDAPDAAANFFSNASIDGNVTVTLDANRQVGALNFNNSTRSFTIVGTSTLSLTTTAGPPSVNVGAGNHVIAVPVSLTANTAINAGIVGGSVTMTNLLPSSIVLSKNGPGLFAANNIRTNSLVINNGTVRILPNSTAAGVSRVNSLTIAASGGSRLDLTDNKLITQGAVGSFNGSVYTGFTGLIASGRNTGNWDGAGIVTSQTQAIGSNYTSIGIAQASDVRPNTATATTLWAGQTITGTDVLVMYTYGGDATLDGKINIDDYVRIDSGISAGLTGWSNGDFNYDGKVSIDDYITVIDANIGNQSGVFFTAGSADANVTAVPEPSAVCTLLIVASLLPRQIRRRR